MCTPQQLQVFGSMQGGLNTGVGGPPTTAASSPVGGPASSGYSSDGGAQLEGPQPGTGGLIPPANLGQYGKRPGREMNEKAGRGREYRPQQVFAQDNGPGPLSGGPVGDYVRKLGVR